MALQHNAGSEQQSANSPGAAHLVGVAVVRWIVVRRRTTATEKRTARFAEPYAIQFETRWYSLREHAMFPIRALRTQNGERFRCLATSQVSISTARKNLKWLSLLGSALLVLASVRSYFVLQLLSATLLFALLFAILASLVASFTLLVIATDQLLEWAAAELASMLRSPSHRFVTSGSLPLRASGISHRIAVCRRKD